MPTTTTATITCPLCGPGAHEKLFDKGGRCYWRCVDCGIEAQHPRPSADELAGYYDGSYRDGMYQTFAAAEEMKRLTATHRLRAIADRVDTGGRWLDVGAANGVFVREARATGIDATGIELSEHAAASARAAGIPVATGDLADLASDQPHDVVTAFDVIEHVLDPRSFLRTIHRHLRPGGSLVLSTPNRRSLSARLMRRRWYFYIPEEHLFVFDPGNLAGLLRDVGFAVDSCTRAAKPLTFAYSMTQFDEYNPAIHAMLRPLERVMPGRLANATVPLPIGEMLLVATRTPST